ncbi:MAG TPA: ABC transporter permease [Candidatus Ruminococcus avistercoris]|nr:ABC transporter permease [Candidatus Ruminococcus avistercoris]
MLLSCIKAEQMKLRRSFIWIAFFLLPLIPAVMGMKNYLNNLELLTSGWYSLWTQETLFYSNFFFGPMIAIYCAYLWRVENFHHNRNALMTAPVPISWIFLGKFISAFSVAVLTQLWVGVLFIATGKAAGLPGLPPLTILFWLIRGLFGALAVTALQCLLSMVIRSFALPIGLAAIGSIVGLLVSNTGFRCFYPYSLMIVGMNANRSEDMLGGLAVSFTASTLLYTLIFLTLSILILKRTDVKA